MLTVASKSALVASDAHVGGQLHQSLAQRGIKLELAKASRDLGLDCTAGAARSTVSHKARARKALRKVIKVKCIKRQAIATGKFLKAAVVSQATWGHQGYGFSPSKLQKLRGALATSFAHWKTGCCTTTLLALEMGMDDPIIKLRMELFATWIDMWRRYPSRRPAWKSAWGLIHKRLSECKDNTRWYNVYGGISVLLSTLMDIGWYPQAPDYWLNDMGGSYFFTDDPVDEVALYQRMKQDLARIGWKNAAKHHGGRGMENGIYLGQLSSKLHNLDKRGKAMQAGALRTDAIAGLWPPARCSQEGMQQYDICEL